MKLEFFKRSASDQAIIIRETAARRGLPFVMVEKDFWVSWTLAALFAHAEFGRQLVFKGGTSLSKVFGVIRRFSEDIDLSVSPAFLGITEEWVAQGSSSSQLKKRMDKLEKACIERVRDQFLPELERVATEALGQRAAGAEWMKFQVDNDTHSPVVLFDYPCSEPSGFDYLTRSVKMEFGSLTDQRPVGTHSIKPWTAEEFAEQFQDFSCNLVALELERTFWEKATILHALHHRNQAKPFRDRYSRHYSDMAALATQAIADRALACGDLRQQVADWKSRFFPDKSAQYYLAKPGTFKLAPPAFRMAELEKDYGEMSDMFLTTPPPFETAIKTVSDLERRINGV